MILDLACLALVGLFVVLGAFSGFWLQAMRLGAMIVAYLGAGWLGPPLGSWLSLRLDLPTLLGEALGTMIAFVLLYLLLSPVCWLVARRLKRIRRARGEGTRGPPWDRIAGAVLGGTKAMVLVYLVLCGLVLVEEPLSRTQGRPLGITRGSLVASIVRGHNALAAIDLPLVGDLATLSRLSADPLFREQVARDPRVLKLLDHPKFRALLGDPDVTRAAGQNDLEGLMGNERLGQALDDPEIRKLLSEIDLSAVEPRGAAAAQPQP